MLQKNNCFHFKAGYHDCEMAQKYNYPQAKLLKLLKRKLAFAFALEKEEFIEGTLREIEGMKISKDQFDRKHQI